MSHIHTLLPLVDLNPDPNNLPKLDPKDQFLLSDPASSTPFLGNGHASGSMPSSSQPVMPHVPWLRRTEYLSREGGARPTSTQDAYVCFLIPSDAESNA